MLKYAYRLGAAQAVKEAYALSGAALGAGIGGLTGYAAPDWFGDDLSRGGGALRGSLGGGALGGLAGGWRGASAKLVKAEADAAMEAAAAKGSYDSVKDLLSGTRKEVDRARERISSLSDELNETITRNSQNQGIRVNQRHALEAELVDASRALRLERERASELQRYKDAVRGVLRADAPDDPYIVARELSEQSGSLATMRETARNLERRRNQLYDIAGIQGGDSLAAHNEMMNRLRLLGGPSAGSVPLEDLGDVLRGGIPQPPRAGPVALGASPTGASIVVSRTDNSGLARLRNLQRELAAGDALAPDPSPLGTGAIVSDARMRNLAREMGLELPDAT